MKQPLATVLAAATPGRLHVRFNGSFHDVNVGDGEYDPTLAMVCGFQEAEQPNAALLAHFWNHGPDLVRVLESALARHDQYHPFLAQHPRCNAEWVKEARALLAECKEVEVGDE